MFKSIDISEVIIVIIFIELIIVMILLFHIQSKVRKHEKEINTFALQGKEREKQIESIQKKTNLLENSIFMLEVRRRSRR